MVGLLSLPEELLTEIYIFTGIRTGALIAVSQVNRRLRGVWLRNSDRIIKNCCALSGPGHEAAIDLALVEARFSQSVDGFQFFDPSKPAAPLRLCLPSISRNIHLASQFCQTLLEWHNTVTARPKSKRRPITQPLPPTYYLFRQVVASFHLPQFRPPLSRHIRDLTQGEIEALLEVALFIEHRVPASMSRLHGMKESAVKTFSDGADVAAETGMGIRVLRQYKGVF